MVMQLTDKDGKQIKPLLDVEFDAELNDAERDFQISIPLSESDPRMQAGGRVFIRDTEIGGILGEISSQTATNTLIWLGYTWRGLMEKKIIVPPEGEDYYIAEGELNSVLRELVEPLFGGVFRVSKSATNVNVKYQFERYCTLLSGLTKMLKSIGYRLEISYNEGEPNQSGWVDVSAVPIIDYSEQIELSQDSRLNFTMKEKKNGTNHLIVLGKGELKDRTVIHLYVQEDGNIGTEPYYTGIDEITEVYDNTSADTAELEQMGRNELLKRMNSKTFEMDVESLGLDIKIGDIVGGRDYITGMHMAKPLDNIIIKISGGKITKEYKLEGVQ